MLCLSTVFLCLFLPLVIIIYYNPFIKSRKFRNIFLLLASLVFYAYGEPIFVFLMLFSIVINYILGRLVTHESHKKLYLSLAYIYNFSILFVFKYLTFVVSSLNLLLKKDIVTINIALPIGISFFTFQMLSYVTDVYRDHTKLQKNIFNVALYISLFPQLIAGPIVRYETVADELENRHENVSDFVSGLYRFVYGLGKKVLIANYVGLIADNIFYNISYTQISVFTAWFGAIAYTLQIYFDFSGYSDMAIGLGKMFGFHFLENFNYPYIASSITDFWRRWHISLSAWFRDYVYIPLGGNRVSKSRHIFNIFIVWLFTGIWHGANYTFIIWGLYFFILLIIEKYTNINKKLKGFSHVYTLLLVIIAWVIFRADSVTIAINYIGTMFGFNAHSLIDTMGIDYIKASGLIIVIGIIAATPIVKYLDKRININKTAKSLIKVVLMLSIFVLSVLSCISATYNPFIYFNF